MPVSAARGADAEPAAPPLAPRRRPTNREKAAGHAPHDGAPTLKARLGAFGGRALWSVNALDAFYFVLIFFEVLLLVVVGF